MKICNVFLVFAIAVIALQSCSSAKNVTNAQLNEKWILKTIENKPAVEVFEHKIPFIIFNFDAEKVSGNSGCNSFNGKFSYNNGIFEAPNLASTMMACIGKNQEPLFHELLGKPSTLSIKNGELIFSQNNQPVLVFTKALPLSAIELTGSWKLESMEGKSANFDFPEKVPTLLFDFSSNRISGNAGCNGYNAPFSLSNNVLEVQPLMTTKMMCGQMDGETKFVNLLPGKNDLELDGTRLILRRDNKTIMIFSRVSYYNSSL